MKEKFKPLVTFIMCSRRQGNPDSDLIRFLNSVAKYVEDQNVIKMEILIKFDDDDYESRDAIYNRNSRSGRRLNNGEKYEQPNILQLYPHNVRHFVYNRGEGRRSLHNDYMFLFSQRNPNSKFIAFATDDCVFINSGLFTELERLKNKDWVFLGDKRPAIEKYNNWRDGEQEWRTDVSMFPIVSTRIIECVQNMGWQVNIDNWITLLASILYHKYGLDFWEGSYIQYLGRSGGASKESQYGKIYNRMEVNNRLLVDNPYYFDLVEQQAKNIALNYHEDKTKELLRKWVN